MFAPVGDDKGGGCFFYPQVIFCISLCSYKKNHTAVNHIEPLRGSFFFSDARTERPYYHYTLTLFADARTERPYSLFVKFPIWVEFINHFCTFENNYAWVRAHHSFKLYWVGERKLV